MVIVDSGFWIALINRRDDYHVLAQEVLDTIDEPLVTTWCVITEACHILLKRTGTNAQQTFIHSLEIGAFEVFDLKVQDGKRISELMNQYSSLPMDLAYFCWSKCFAALVFFSIILFFTNKGKA